nr:hypothetical protein [Tanacetum cinerariifolium]
MECDGSAIRKKQCPVSLHVVSIGNTTHGKLNGHKAPPVAMDSAFVRNQDSEVLASSMLPRNKEENNINTNLKHMVSRINVVSSENNSDSDLAMEQCKHQRRKRPHQLTDSTNCQNTDLPNPKRRKMINNNHRGKQPLSKAKDEDLSIDPHAHAIGKWRKSTEDVLPWPGNANMAFDLRPTKDVLSWPGNANMVFDLRPTKDVLPWTGNANIVFDLRPTEDVLSWSGSANMVFDLRPTKDVLPWPGNANMVFDLRPTEDVLPWPGNANMVFDLRPTKDVPPWPGSANMVFDLRLTEDVLPWPALLLVYCVVSGMIIKYKLLNNHNGMATRTKERISALLGTGARRMCHVECHGRTESMTAVTKKENISGHGRTEPMTADTKKEKKVQACIEKYENKG